TRYHVATMPRVSVRDLKNHLSDHLRRLERGQPITVTRRGKPVAVLSPAAGDGEEVRRKLGRLAAEGVVSWSGGKPRGLHPRVKLSGEGPSVSEMVIQDRR
ncbi:MAG TPA: type II toxin-antitoxin system prevent-host-death family antitoxin, partial [Dehalococcoidia bacterium]|nr:type II toxin-antitoxin system prevent-host-death family antitoxin [Dehalococcoidia bacterium]